MYQTVIFDVDGTLINTEKVIITCLVKILHEETGINYQPAELQKYMGIPAEAALTQLGIKNKGIVLEKWVNAIGENRTQFEIYPGIEKTLIKLKAKAIRLGIVTSRALLEYERDEKLIKLDPYFEHHICFDHTERHKPFPDPILKFIDISGCSKDSAIYIGDTDHDQKAAASAGIDFGFAGWGKTNPPAVSQVPCFARPADLVEYIFNQ